jgi:DNA-binding GntR family transcriptional regulator
VPEHATVDSLSEQAYYLLRDRIVTLQIAPGSMINERELVEELGIGRTPIRDALRRLDDDGLVAIYPRRGVYVGAIDVGDLGAISELRLELEGVAALLAAERAAPADRDDIGVLLAEIDAAVGETDQRRLMDLDQRIHRLIYRLARNPFLEAALDRSYVLALRLWFLAIERIHRLHDAIAEHRELLEAIRAGDAAAAEAVARTHVAEFEAQVRRLL